MKRHETLFIRRFGEHAEPVPERRYTPLRLMAAIVLIACVSAIVVSGEHRFNHNDAMMESGLAVQPPLSGRDEGWPESSVDNGLPAIRATATVTAPTAVVPTIVATVPTQEAAITPDDLAEYQPNELGVVPVLEYHVITTDPEAEEQFVRTADNMRADLQWLYEHHFYIVPLRDVVNNTIAVPAGKHPVALTFDDGSSTQFAFIEDDQGELVPDPDTAIGILEAFSAEHPDFGHGGHFAILINNALAWPDESQMPYFVQKIQWMVEHGYEIGNHTMHHTNLTDITNDEFKMTVAEPMIWADEVIGDRLENASRILTLPYGTMPDDKKHPDQRQAMRSGFSYQGQQFHISAALLVGADPAYSPASTQWDPMMIPRIQMFEESVDFWFGMFESGGVILYTSDGDPDTIVVPNPLPPMLDGHLDAAALTNAGKRVIQYEPETGQPVLALHHPVHVVAGSRDQRHNPVRLSIRA